MVLGPTAMWQGSGYMPARFSCPHPYSSYHYSQISKLNLKTVKAQQSTFSTGSHPTARLMSTGSLGIYDGMLGAETESCKHFVVHCYFGTLVHAMIVASRSEFSSTLAPPPSSSALYQAQLLQLKANVTARMIAKFKNHLVLTCQVIIKHSTISSETRIPKDLKHLITEFWNQSAREVGYCVYSS
jgi:hypothetical protein